MKDNPIYRLSRKRTREYQKLVLLYGKRSRQLFTKHKATPYNQKFLRKWLFNLADNLGKDTQRHLVDVVEEVIGKTLNTYNSLHQGQKLSKDRLAELQIEILKDFLLSDFKGKTLDQRVSHSVRRLKDNLQRELQILITEAGTGSKGQINNLINSIIGTDYKEGGTAYRWNSRLVLSEMYRAYQFTGKVVLAELGVAEVEWRNTERTSSETLKEYAEKVYTPLGLPEYPYPCNDSYFIPIY
jgi:hypothetical protein